MFEQPVLPTQEKEPSPIDQLVAYLQSLPNNHGIQGQVQIEVVGSKGVYQESAMYGFKTDGDSFSFEAADAGGTIRTFTSVDGSVDIFCDDAGRQYKVVFPGFVAKE